MPRDVRIMITSKERMKSATCGGVYVLKEFARKRWFFGVRGLDFLPKGVYNEDEDMNKKRKAPAVS